MVKVYYSYEIGRNVGQIASRNCNFQVDSKGKLLVCGTNQYVSIIDIKTGEVLKYLSKKDKNVPVRFVRLALGKVIAGYEDGEIVLWELDGFQLVNCFDMHKSTVSCICVSADGTKMVSGGLDCSIVIWDLLSEEAVEIKSAHHNAITQIEVITVTLNGKPTDVILSLGKDGFFKVWNIETQLCLSALSTHTTQALSMAFNEELDLLYIGTNKEDLLIVKFDDNYTIGTDLCTIVATIKRPNFSRCLELYQSSNCVYALTSEKVIEVYEILSEGSLTKKKKRIISRKKQLGNRQQEGGEQQTEINEYKLHLRFQSQKVVLFKVYGCQVYRDRIYVNDGTNLHEVVTSKKVTQAADRTLQLQLEYPFLMQRSPQSCKIYQSTNFQLLFSVPIKVVAASLFNGQYLLTVDKKVVMVWDLARNQCILQFEEKWEGCWAKGIHCLLWSANTMAFYQIGKDKHMNTRMKELSRKDYDDVIISAVYTHSSEKYIVSLNNSQMQIFYADTHKTFLKLYGHKMPVTSFDLSSDNALLASGSSDKDIRLWDMDYGHCIKSIFAHSEPVTIVRFIPETHYLLSGAKDGHVKFWDADTWQLIFDLEENMQEIRGLAVTSAGENIVAGGFDGGFRVWHQTGDQAVATDQEERKLEKVMVEEYAVDKLKNKELKTKYEDLKHGEEIIEALESCEQPKVLMGLLKKIPPSSLKASLSFLHEEHVTRLENYLGVLIKRQFEADTCWRVLDALERPSHLQQKFRYNWESLSKMLRVNRAGLHLLIKAVNEEKELTL